MINENINTSKEVVLIIIFESMQTIKRLIKTKMLNNLSFMIDLVKIINPVYMRSKCTIKALTGYEKPVIFCIGNIKHAIKNS